MARRGFRSVTGIVTVLGEVSPAEMIEAADRAMYALKREKQPLTDLSAGTTAVKAIV